MLLRLTDHAVTNLLPAVTNTNNAPTVSERYKHVQTSNVIDALGVHGFKVSGQRQRSDTGKHGVILVNRQQGFLDRSGSENFATVTLFNSHDGKGAVQLIAGYFRAICSNGMVSGELMDTLRVRHSENGLNSLTGIVAMLPERLQAYAHDIMRMQNTELTTKDKISLAQNVFERIETLRAIPTPADLLFARRENDLAANDLYTVANIIQENIIKGGMRSRESNRRLRAVTGLQSQTELTQLVMVEATKLIAA